ncbi:MAG: nucleotidyltransferase domain-containing protein [Lachnospiraceae bacterium]|nr:nucleotidyltransferase domain-containing protein [Lachnospiraceae bacterium]
MKRRCDVRTIEEENTISRLYGLLELQKEVEKKFGSTGYNVFVFGSYLTTRYIEGESDVDIAVYSKDFDLYINISSFLETYFKDKKIKSDIFYIDISMEAPIYCAPLKSQVQFTDFYPEELVDFYKRCQEKLEVNKARMAV